MRRAITVQSGTARTQDGRERRRAVELSSPRSLADQVREAGGIDWLDQVMVEAVF